MKRVIIILSILLFWSNTSLAYRTSIYYKHTRSSGETQDIRVRINISDSFQGNEQSKLTSAFKIIADEVGEFYRAERNGSSQFRRCLNKYATKDIHPVQYANVNRSKAQRISNLMSSMVMMFGIHKNKSFRAMINYFTQPRKPGGEIVTGNAPVYTSEWPKTKIFINMNDQAVRDQNNSTREISGTIFHEIMHNLGWRHPTGYPGSFIKEAGLCIARNNADRPAGFGLTGDSGYKFLD